MLPVLQCLVGTPINLTGGIITNGTGLSAPIFYFVNRTIGLWSALSSATSKCATKDTSVNAFSTSLSLHNSVALLYCESMSHSHIILSGC